MFDEINPHIVRQLNRDKPEGIFDIESFWNEEARKAGHDVGESRVERTIAMHAEFVRKYDIARKAVLKHKPRYKGEDVDFAAIGKELGQDEPFVPLTYRLDVLTAGEKNLEKDKLKKEKLGGIPNISYKVFRACGDKAMYYDLLLRSKTHDETYIKRQFPNGRPEVLPLHKGLERAWPKCGACGRYQRFIGQMDYSHWMNAIHWATKRKIPQWYGEVSAFGSTRDPDGLLQDGWHCYFYCPCNDFENVNSDCSIFRSLRPSSPQFDLTESGEIKKKEKSKPLYTEAQYKRAVHRFMRKHEIHPDQLDDLADQWPASNIPLKFITGYELNFDLDYISHYIGEYDDAIHDALPPSAGKYGSDFTLFGAAYSQQEPRRYMSIKGYDQPMRQSPLLSWTDATCDFSFQIYGDFRGCDIFRQKPMQCKYDGSCT